MWMVKDNPLLIQETSLDIDQLSSVRARAQVAELPNKIKRFELKQNQNTLYNSFSDWAGTIYTLIGLRMKQKTLAPSKDLSTSKAFAILYFKNGSIKS
jgi:hypothetical protein